MRIKDVGRSAGPHLSARERPRCRPIPILDVREPERLVFTLTQRGNGQAGPETTVVVDFTEEGGRTHMAFEQSGYTSKSMRDGNAEGWLECFQKLEAHLRPQPQQKTSNGVSQMAAAEEELRKEFADWLAAAAKKDLDAVMQKIEDNVVSYEHDAPLVYNGAAAVREVCRRGFEAMPGEFNWDIPDLQIIVRDDIAVTWGLNRMRAKQSGQDEFVSWSRGTRIFQRKGDGWKLIHQHVSYPYDPETGEAKLFLRP
jgi:ketosteroid isomerase-like protein